MPRVTSWLVTKAILFDLVVWRLEWTNQYNYIGENKKSDSCLATFWKLRSFIWRLLCQTIQPGQRLVLALVGRGSFLRSAAEARSCARRQRLVPALGGRGSFLRSAAEARSCARRQRLVPALGGRGSFLRSAAEARSCARRQRLVPALGGRGSFLRLAILPIYLNLHKLLL